MNHILNRRFSYGVLFPALVVLLQLVNHYIVSTGEYVLNSGLARFLHIIALVLLLGLIIKSKRERIIAQLPLVLIAAGLLSNIIDSLLWGGVVDYLNFMRLIYFNLADCLIVLGAGWYGYKIYRHN